jgi:pyridoxamine 5'-phosphate oxidase
MELHDLHRNPILQFEGWLEDARTEVNLEFPHAVSLATSTPEGRPSVRMVLFKGLHEEGFTFFTNGQSRKGRELTANPFAALCFYWETLGRQVRVEGAVEKLPAADSDAYFHSRPRGSQLSALASPQSEPIETRAELEARMKALDAKFPGAVPRPAQWGGYRVVPDRIEFWKNGKNRLHDRFEYLRSGSEWKISRLAP